MKPLLPLLLLMTFVPNGVQAEPQSGFKIFSMNLHCFEADWKKRFETVLARLAPEDIAVYAFQELCIGSQGDQVAYLSRRIRELHPGAWSSNSVFTHRAWDKYDELLLIMARGSSLSVRSALLPFSPLRRGFVSIQFEGAWFVNTHLEYHEDNSAFRLEQIGHLVNEFDAQPGIIMGDFNSSPNMDEQAPFRQALYKSQFPGPTFPASDPEMAIDGFWLSPQMNKRVRPLSVQRLFGPGSEDGIQSDHLGVLLEIESRQ